MALSWQYALIRSTASCYTRGSGFHRDRTSLLSKKAICIRTWKRSLHTTLLSRISDHHATSVIDTQDAHLLTTSIWRKGAEWTKKLGMESAEIDKLFRANQHQKILDLWEERYGHSTNFVNLYWAVTVLRSMRYLRKTSEAVDFANMLLRVILNRRNLRVNEANMCIPTITHAFMKAGEWKRVENMLCELHFHSVPVVHGAFIWIEYVTKLPSGSHRAVDLLQKLGQKYPEVKKAHANVTDLLVSLFKKGNPVATKRLIGLMQEWEVHMGASELVVLFDACRTSQFPTDNIAPYLQLASQLPPPQITVDLVYSIAKLRRALALDLSEAGLAIILWQRIRHSQLEHGNWKTYHALCELIHIACYLGELDSAVSIYKDSLDCIFKREEQQASAIRSLFEGDHSPLTHLVAQHIAQDIYYTTLDGRVIFLPMLDISTIHTPAVNYIFVKLLKGGYYKSAQKLLQSIYCSIHTHPISSGNVADILTGLRDRLGRIHPALYSKTQMTQVELDLDRMHFPGEVPPETAALFFSSLEHILLKLPDLPPSYNSQVSVAPPLPQDQFQL